MMRSAVVVTAMALLLGSLTSVARVHLERLEEQRLEASLLYLPKGHYLRAMSLGHEETLADIFYVWSLQYYSNYSDEKRFDYLEQVFSHVIAELDPRFVEVYLVGALIMSTEAGRSDLALDLYDKGLERNPDSWELAYWAGWESYDTKDYTRARIYWKRAAEMPGAPPFIERLASRMLEYAGDLRAALAEYVDLAENAEDERTRKVARVWIDRVMVELAEDLYEEALEQFELRHGRCVRDLDEVVRAGILSAHPSLPEGRTIRLLPETCAIEVSEARVLEQDR